MIVAQCDCLHHCVQAWSFMQDCPAVDELIVHDQPGLRTILQYAKCPLRLTLYSRLYGRGDDRGINVTIQAVERWQEHGPAPQTKMVGYDSDITSRVQTPFLIEYC